MTIGTTPSRITSRQRKVPRYKLAVPLGLTVLRAGMPDKIPGSTTEIRGRRDGRRGRVTAAVGRVGPRRVSSSAHDNAGTRHRVGFATNMNTAGVFSSCECPINNTPSSATGRAVR